MEQVYSAVCLLCGRTLGRVVRGQFVAQPRTARPEVDGQRLRCGHCRGSVLLEPDPAARPPRDWVAEMRRELAAGS